MTTISCAVTEAVALLHTRWAVTHQTGTATVPNPGIPITTRHPSHCRYPLSLYTPWCHTRTCAHRGKHTQANTHGHRHSHKYTCIWSVHIHRYTLDTNVCARVLTCTHTNACTHSCTQAHTDTTAHQHVHTPHLSPPVPRTQGLVGSGYHHGPCCTASLLGTHSRGPWMPSWILITSRGGATSWHR